MYAKYLFLLSCLITTLAMVVNGAETPKAGEADTKSEPAKRFYSWEGKRYDDSKQVDKRKFYQWAGKRSGGDDKDDDATSLKEASAAKEGGETTLDDEERDVNKRKFYQWAGKRKFYAWAGKRDMDDESHDNAAPVEEKRKFYQWAGKRSESQQESDNNEISYENALDKRKFYAWAGKRAHDGAAAADKSEEQPSAEKRKFYAWAG